MCLLPGLADGRFVTDSSILDEDLVVPSSAFDHCGCAARASHAPQGRGISRRGFLVRGAGIGVGAVVGTAALRSATARAATPPVVPAKPEGDYLLMLGVGGGPILNRAHFEPATLLVVNGHRYLIDCGSDTPHQIAVSGLGFTGVQHVFVTHHHLDHVGGIPTLSPMGWIYEPAPLLGSLNFWGPPELNSIVGRSHAGLEPSIALFEPGVLNPPFPHLHPHEFDTPPFRPHYTTAPRSGIVKVMEDENVLVHACRVFHGTAVPNAFAYRFEIKRTRKVVVFSGDRKSPYSAAADRLFVELARDADLLVHEALLMSAVDTILQGVEPKLRKSLRAAITGGHTDVRELPGIAKAANASRLVTYHYVPAAPPPSAFLATATAAAQQVRFAGEIIAPTDLDVIPL